MSDVACSLCHTTLLPEEAVEECPECRAVFHAECHADNGGCGTYGCGRVPSDPKQAAGVVQPTFWGQETKNCPACKKSIRAAALRCRHCGARFTTAAPLASEDYERESEKKQASAALNRLAPWIFVAGVIPCTAPLVLCIGGPYILFHARDPMRRIAPLPRLLARLGFAIAGAWVIVGLLVLVMT